MTIDDAVILALGTGFTGAILWPGDDAYEDARKVHNGMIDRRPALIARCLGTADVVAAVNCARENELDVAVRGGGHNVAGNAVCDDGLMIDLSLMKGIHIDPNARTAQAQPGLTWAEFNRETQVHGLATTGGMNLLDRHRRVDARRRSGLADGQAGMCVDNLRSVEVVTAAGEVLTASEREHTDLFWGLRGGGGNFGIATSFEYQLHPVGEMVSGIIAHPFDSARDVLRFYREFTASLPDELTVFCGLLHAPDGSGTPIAAITLCHCGSPADAEAAVRPVKEFGSPIVDEIAPRSYEVTNTLLDDGFPKGALIGEGQTDTAFPHRQIGYNLLIISEWQDAADSDANITWARETYDAMRPQMAGGRYVNYLGEEEGEDSVAAAYGPNYQRLRALKDTYDPQNLFHMNQNIPPSAR